jgi:hypothetical protein
VCMYVSELYISVKFLYVDIDGSVCYSAHLFIGVWTYHMLMLL